MGSHVTQLKALREVDQKEEDPSSKTWVFQKVEGKIIWKKDGRMEKQGKILYIVFVLVILMVLQLLYMDESQ